MKKLTALILCFATVTLLVGLYYKGTYCNDGRIAYHYQWGDEL